jgi:hypothetical protein
MLLALISGGLALIHQRIQSQYQRAREARQEAEEKRKEAEEMVQQMIKEHPELKEWIDPFKKKKTERSDRP